MERQRLMNELYRVDFAITELNLYLDTHPECTAALQMLHEQLAAYEELSAAYAQEFGPLTIDQVTGCHYTWTQAPWPWEKEA